MADEQSREAAIYTRWSAAHDEWENETILWDITPPSTNRGNH